MALFLAERGHAAPPASVVPGAATAEGKWSGEVVGLSGTKFLCVLDTATRTARCQCGLPQLHRIPCRHVFALFGRLWPDNGAEAPPMALEDLVGSWWSWTAVDALYSPANRPSAP